MVSIDPNYYRLALNKGLRRGTEQVLLLRHNCFASMYTFEPWIGRHEVTSFSKSRLKHEHEHWIRSSIIKGKGMYNRVAWVLCIVCSIGPNIRR